ncbi:hypothetical protein PDPJ_3_00062 [Photobacterium damselae subsp. piscicida]|nr:hypothetical protein PDPJ_3_00062 [Photobacterium damselae subsp. piscicida]
MDMALLCLCGDGVYRHADGESRAYRDWHQVLTLGVTGDWAALFYCGLLSGDAALYRQLVKQGAGKYLGAAFWYHGCGNGDENYWKLHQG